MSGNFLIGILRAPLSAWGYWRSVVAAGDLLVSRSDLLEQEKTEAVLLCLVPLRRAL